jgi:hypothetical protein
VIPTIAAQVFPPLRRERGSAYKQEAGSFLCGSLHPSISLVAAGACGFFTLIQSGDRSDRSRRLATSLRAFPDGLGWTVAARACMARLVWRLAWATHRSDGPARPSGHVTASQPRSSRRNLRSNQRVGLVSGRSHPQPPVLGRIRAWSSKAATPFYSLTLEELS